MGLITEYFRVWYYTTQSYTQGFEVWTADHRPRFQFDCLSAADAQAHADALRRDVPGIVAWYERLPADQAKNLSAYRQDSPGAPFVRA